ncbi:hypothetical protein M7I_1251 [Glarea lozoyensis 74030]|uniref:Uncharacterized protein n=1 Tax=Glarea lozoyensis (strain ATCC 74030 / MF5533) TaxID=1104152 RepID=H0EFH6_GLAL7|nr:hypothetical protein M7I_1251 [Glarea lozoyensis 74030]
MTLPSVKKLIGKFSKAQMPNYNLEDAVTIGRRQSLKDYEAKWLQRAPDYDHEAPPPDYNHIFGSRLPDYSDLLNIRDASS